MSLLAPVRPVFRAAAEAILPAAGVLDEAGWAAVENVVENALAQHEQVEQCAVVVRELGEEEIRGLRFSAEHYVENARRYRTLSVQDSPDTPR